MNRLTKQATINRVTFYLHYRDIPDMLEKMADEMIEDISTVGAHFQRPFIAVFKGRVRYQAKTGAK
ncbi:MAG TPA: hypothetical protein DDY49_01140 [Paenibacillaceae bacterium]|nr:hypothetical protein [Paenibacillaceae bacterium]